MSGGSPVPFAVDCKVALRGPARARDQQMHHWQSHPASPQCCSSPALQHTASHLSLGQPPPSKSFPHYILCLLSIYITARKNKVRVFAAQKNTCDSPAQHPMALALAPVATTRHKEPQSLTLVYKSPASSPDK